MALSSRSRIVGSIAVLTAAAGLIGRAQPPASQLPTFKSGVEYVDVDVVVTDGEGHFVRGLTRDDFEVLEDGRRQEITAFSTVEIPIDREPAALLAPVPVEPDVISNERPFNGRIYLMVLDDLHTDPVRTTMVRRAGRQFIERNFGANDLMAVVHTGGRAQASQEFTSDKRLLIAAV
jgi:VWFA-related protein